MSATTYVMLHGFTGEPAVFDDVVRALPGSARVIRPWLPGHGPSPEPVAPWSTCVARLGDAILARLDDARNVHLCGYSMGGRLALALLREAPERFARATILGAHPGLADPGERAARRANDAPWIDLLRTQGVEEFAVAWEALTMWDSQRSLPSEALRLQRRARRAHTASGLADAMERLGLAEMPEVALERIEVPVAWMVGARDDKHRDLAAQHVERLPRGVLRVVADAGHNLVLERPEAVAAQLLEELAS